MKNKLLTIIALVILGVQDLLAQDPFGAVVPIASSFKTNAVLVGKYVSVGVLGLAMIWMIYTLTSDSPKKKEAVMSFIIAAVLNTVLWGFIQ